MLGALPKLETDPEVYPIPIEGEVEINEEERVVVVDVEEDETEIVEPKEATLSSSIANKTRQEKVRHTT